MPTRRQFVQFSLLLFATPLLPRAASARSSEHGPLPIILERGAPPAAFMQACDVAMLDACCEATAHLADFGAWLVARKPDAVFGLTRDANHVLYAQIALAHGYALGYRGVHDGRAENLHHRLHGDARCIEALGAPLRAGVDWPRALAETLPALAASATLVTASDIAHPREPAAAPDYWVSWVLRPCRQDA